MSVSLSVDHLQIFRGKIYWTAIPFSQPNPLVFFESCSTCSESTGCTNAKNDCGRSIKRDVVFNKNLLKTTESGKSIASVIIPHKIRPAIILQKDLYNHRTDYDSIIVLPIQSLYREKKSPSFLQKLTVENSIPQLHYIGMHTGNESFVSLSDIKRLHKTYLIEPMAIPPITEESIIEMCNKLADLLDVKQIPACKDCHRNCDNFTFKKAAVNE